MTDRRRFLQTGLLAAGALAVPGMRAQPKDASTPARVVATWDFGVQANSAAWRVLETGGSALGEVVGLLSSSPAVAAAAIKSPRRPPGESRDPC